MIFQKKLLNYLSDLSPEITEEKIDNNKLEISENNKIIKMKKDGNAKKQINKNTKYIYR